MKPPKPDRRAHRSSLIDAVSARIAVGVACIATVVVTITLFAESALPVVFYRLIVDGGICLLWLLAAVGWGALIQRVAKYRISINLLDFVNAAALGIGLVSLMVLGLGLAGGLNRITAWALVAIGIAHILITLGTRLIDLRAAKAWLGESSRWSLLWVFAMPALGIALVAALAPPGILWGDEPHGYDVVEYHLQVPREWYEADQILPLHHNVFSFMPMNVELHYLLAMHLRGGPWTGMYLAQLMHVTLTALAVVAILALIKETAGPPAAMVSALATASAPWLLLLAPVAYNEGGLLFFGAMSIGWAWRALRDPEHEDWRCWALSGAFAGFACGTKLTAVPVLLLGIPIAMIVAQLISRSKIEFRSVAIFAITGLLVFSPWLIRNQIWAGNPVFPEAMSVLGRGHFNEDQQERWRRAHSPTESQRSIQARLQAAWKQIIVDWRFAYAPLPAAILAIGLSRRRESWFVAVLIAIGLIFWIAFTHLQGRFLVLAIPMAAFAIAGGISAAPQLRLPAAINFALVSILGVMNLHLRYLSRDEYEPGRLAAVIGANALGVEELFPMSNLDTPSDELLVLIGAADAFSYNRPMKLLRYRTVFDVAQRANESVVDAWAGHDVPAGAIWLIDPGELARMSKSYWMISPPPVEIANRRSPFLVEK